MGWRGAAQPGARPPPFPSPLWAAWQPTRRGPAASARGHDAHARLVRVAVFGRRLCAWDPPGSRGKIAPCSSPPTSRCPFFSHLAQLALLASRPCKIVVATIVEVSSSSSSPFPSPFSPPFFSVARGVPQPRSAASIFPCVRGVARPALGHGATARGPPASPARSGVRSPSPCAQPGESAMARPLRARPLPSAWRRVARSPARSPGSTSARRGLRPASAWRRGVPGAAQRATRDSPACSPGSASARRGLCPASAWRRGVPVAARRSLPAQLVRGVPAARVRGAFATPGVARSRPLLDVECLLRLSSPAARSRQPARFARSDSLARVAGPSPARLHRLVRGTANPFAR
jgi:hypothetical protein